MQKKLIVLTLVVFLATLLASCAPPPPGGASEPEYPLPASEYFSQFYRETAVTEQGTFTILCYKYNHGIAGTSSDQDDVECVVIPGVY